MIELDEILHLKSDMDYKLHLAINDGESDPLDLFVNDRVTWQAWNEWKGSKDDFNREYIFSLIRFTPQKNRWLFGGIYRVLDRKPDCYVVHLENLHKEFIGRLLVEFSGSGARGRSFKLERYYSGMKVAQIFETEYSGETFRGFDEVRHSFAKLENIIKKQKLDWKRALSSVKGVYLITDTSNGKVYVGSAYGECGIWSRWETYVYTGHGWNEGLSKVLEKEGIDYAKNNFTFSLLDFYSMRTDDRVILEREYHWKKVLCSRKFGYNRN